MNFNQHVKHIVEFKITFNVYELNVEWFLSCTMVEVQHFCSIHSTVHSRFIWPFIVKTAKLFYQKGNPFRLNQKKIKK